MVPYDGPRGCQSIFDRENPWVFHGALPRMLRMVPESNLEYKFDCKNYTISIEIQLKRWLIPDGS